MRARHWLRWVALCVALVGAVVAACSGLPESPRGLPDGGSGATSPLGLASRLAAGEPAALAALSAPEEQGFRVESGAWTSPAFADPRQGPGWAVGARLEGHAHRRLEVRLSGSERYAFGLTPVGAAAVPGVLEGGRLVYAGAYPSTDVIVAADASRVAWMYLLHDRSAPTELILTLDLPGGLVAARLDDAGDVVLTDQDGEGLLRVTHPVLLDAEGRRREIPFELAGGALRIALATEGLTFPVLVDPAIETVVWELKRNAPRGRASHGLALDELNEEIVMFGGWTGTYSGETWVLKNGAWQLRSTSGPSPRYGAAMAWNPDLGRVVLFGGGNAAGYHNDTWEWDGTQWTQGCGGTGCATRPPVRESAAMAYQPGLPAPGYLMMFGGTDGGTYYDDIWQYTGTTWVDFTGGTRPSGRSNTPFAYDIGHNYLLLHGGFDDNSQLNDTWSWSYGAWTNRTPGTNQGPVSYGHGMAYEDLDIQNMLLYGGWGPSGASARLWEWTGTGWFDFGVTDPGPLAETAMVASWGNYALVLVGGYSTGSLRTLNTWSFTGLGLWNEDAQPAPRHGAPLAYDSARERTIMFGGADTQAIAGTWEWAGFTWKPICSAANTAACPVSARYDHGLTFHTTRAAAVAFGGYTGSADLNDTWEYNGTWTARCGGCVTGTSRPPARRRHAQAYDATRDRTVVFGGLSGVSTRLSDQWAWNGTVWAAQCGACVAGTGKPTARDRAAMVFDVSRNVTVLFGGNNGTTLLNDVWEWDGTNWFQRCTLAPCSTGARPGIRQGASLTYDSTRQRVLLYGGNGSGATVYTDTWEWSGTAWTQTTTGAEAGAPGSRMAHGATYDAARRRTVVHGGLQQSFTELGDTWELHTRGAACSLAGFCNTGYCVDGVCCESGQCGVCQACNTAASPGVCAPVLLGADPDTCTGTSSCDASGQCRLSNGQACTLASQCASGFCADGFCCDQECAGGCDRCSVALGASANGTCTLGAAGTAGTCVGILCDGTSGSCPTTCDADGDCAAAYYCASDSTCRPRVAQGGACDSAAGQDCLVASCRVCAGSTTCVDRVCCASACTGTCQSCVAGTPGTCVTLSSGYDDTCGTPNACGAGGVCRKDLGQSCAAGAECASGFCADGVCCSTACAGGCDACTLALGAATDGTCALLGPGAVGAGCGRYVCGATAACPTTCTSDAACVASAWCDAGSATCLADQADGATCTSGAQCTSGNCVDGVCCNTTCAGACQACSAARKGSGANGTCGNVAAGTDPDSECPTDAASTCDRDGTCNGAGACRLYVTGTTCGAGTCAAGLATAFTCDGTGTCNGSNTACAPFACAATGCVSTCANDSQCATGFYCSAGACLARVAAGTACTAANQCQSGFCVDGVCCDSACAGGCQACTAAKKGSGASGVCGNVGAGSDPDAECAADPASTCRNDGACDGAGACRLHASGTVCATPVCASATLTTSACNGTGLCVSGGTPCGTGYACATGASCATTCTTDAACAGGYYCRSSDQTCQPRAANGSACTLGAACQSGFCVDGVCCDSACAGTCQACTAAKKGSGSDGSCGAIPVAADPDVECVAQAASTCGRAGGCDGASACRLWAFGTTCGSTTCAAALQTGQVCNGSGACVAGSSAPCPSGYVCADASSCATACTSDTQCALSYHCRTATSTCQPDGASGAACSAGSQCQSGFCVDGVCCDSACTGACQACSAAKKGAGADGACGSVAPDTDPDAECTADLPSSCGQTGSCNGAGACQKYAPGASCGASTCAAGVQTGYQCDGFGACQAGQTVQCSPYVCADGSTCRATCATDADCVGTAWCEPGAGLCRGDLPKGGTCGRAAQCQTGFCADGVCCDQTCDGTCLGCTTALKGVGADGDCGPVGAGTDPKAHCPADSTASCQRTGLCDGAGDCALQALGTACGATTCANGLQSGLACNGLGSCVSAGALSCAPYTCDGAACAAACVDDTDCVPSHHCRASDGTCQSDLGGGAACTLGTQCTSGNCVDGVCCESPCTGVCQACSAARTGQVDGACRSVLVATDPDDECPDEGATSCKRSGLCSGLGACALYAPGVACGSTTCAAGSQTGFACDGLGTCVAGQTSACAPYTCSGTTACRSDCAGDADCVAGAHCQLATATCVPDLPTGSACAGPSGCQSGFCVDGVCCDQACTGTCRACTAARKGSGTDGTCDLITAGADPDDDCAAEAPSTCGTDGACDGAGACRRWAPGTGCGTNACAGATLTGSQCDGFGACVAGQSTSCEPYLCLGGTTCGTTCAGDADCVGRAFCEGGSCVDRRPNGAACAAAGACQSGFCVEGVCCDTACNGTCQACTQASKGGGADGVCGNARAGIDPQAQCADEGTTSCGRDGECDGAGACRSYPTGTVCGATTCSDGAVVGLVCAGPRLCQAGAQVDCRGYGCAAGVCLTTCAADADCASSHFCAVGTGVCEPKAADGTACAAGSECQSGHCVDGVCCSSACTGQCEACDVPSAPGRCTPVVGAPHGERPACSGATGAEPDQLCQARTCDGSLSTSQCLGWVGPEVACRDRGCAAGVATFSGACNGAGACGVADAATSRPCAPYVCGGETCKDFCLADLDCAPGFRCDPSGECLGATTCDGDHSITDSRGQTTDCAPFRCTDEGTCLDRCATSADCVSGTVCNADDVCVTPTGAQAAEEGGCGCRAAGSSRSSQPAGWLALVSLGLVVLRRGAGAARRRAWALLPLVAAAALTLGCASEPGAGGAAPDGGAALAAAASPVTLALAERLAAPHADLSARLAPQVGGGFTIEGRELVSPAWRAARHQPALVVGSRVPETADGLFVFGIGRSEAFRIALHPIDAAPVAAGLDAGRVLYPEIHPATDLIVTADEARAEWMLLLRDERAPRRFRYDLEVGQGMPGSRLDPGGALLLLDAAGEALLRVSRPVAFDAAGATRDLGMSWSAGELVIEADLDGLTFPVLIDPSVEVVVWEQKAGPPRARRYHAMGYDGTRRNTVLFGGGNASGPFGDTWIWDGTAWQLRSTTGPAPRNGAAMAWDSARSRMVLFGGLSSGGLTLGDTWEWDGTSWAQACLTACTAPPTRWGHGLTFDSGRNVAVLFGGYLSGGTVTNQLYEFNGTTWTSRGTGATARANAAVVYDPVRAVTVIAGGSDGTTTLADTWTWNGTAFTNLGSAVGFTPRYAMGATWSTALSRVLTVGGNGGGGPVSTVQSWTGTAWVAQAALSTGVRQALGAANDGDRGRVVTFGGTNGSATYLATTLEWAPDAWADPVGMLSPRVGASAGYNSTRARSVLFGGASGGVALGETWEWNGFSWTKTCAACSPPVVRTEHAVATDATTWLFGGRNGGTYYNDLWNYTGTAWTQVCSACAGKPPVRARAAATYWPAASQFHVFGGQGPGLLGTHYSYTGGAWTQRCVACVAGTTIPTARVGASMAASTVPSSGAPLLVFGGTNGAGAYYNDLWTFAGTAWAPLCNTAPCNATRPAARADASFVYDSTRDEFILWGGSNAGGALGDTWTWSGTAWKQTTTGAEAGAPPARDLQASAFDSGRRRMVTFGGRSGTSELGDTWELHVRSGDCVSPDDCQTGFCVDGVCCETAQCPTCQACDLPGSPGLCAFVPVGPDTDSCTGTLTCDGLGSCRKVVGQGCSLGSECASGFCQNGVCCGTACAGGCDVCSVAAGATMDGTCTLRPDGAAGTGCGAMLCNGTSAACPTTCATDVDCASTHFCGSDQTCQVRRSQGQACNTGVGGDCRVSGCRECTGTLGCVDGVCCTSACTGTCQTCRGTTPGTCTTITAGPDPGTCVSPSTCAAGGACRKLDGQACTLGTECASGACSDGVCCNLACTGGCDACRTALGASTDGVCTALGVGSAGSGCAPYLCSGGAACPSTCASDAACAAGYYCRPSDSTCQIRLANGAACGAASHCTSGFCVDGVCCSTACTGACQACSAGKTGGVSGTCGAVSAGTDPDAECPADAASGCQRDGTCDGAGACRLHLPGTSCGATTCVSGTASVLSCNGSGTCAPANTPCAPYACNGAAGCHTACVTDAECASGQYCSASACVPKRAQGQLCLSANECSSGFCADGYCCDAACAGACQACSAARKGSGVNGACGAVAAGTDPDAECPDDGSASCQRDGFCNGAGACRVYGAGVTCAATTCSGGSTTARSCDGGGACGSSVTPCATGYACASSSACAIACSSDTQCATGYYCQTSDGTCRSKAAIGAACAAGSQCQSGSCVDGFCCDTTCAGPCQACSAARKGSGADGTCGAIREDTDPDAECAASSPSTCGLTGSCNGAGACKSWPSGTACGTTTCAAGVQTGQICNGSGACVSGASAPCGTGYVCASASACAVSCGTDAQCAAGSFCRVTDGTCQPDLALGAACSAASQCQGGRCVDGVCCDAPCGGACQACSAARKGGGVDGVCGNVAAETDPDDECAAGSPSTCGLDGFCDGAGACGLYGPGTVCGTTTCATGTQTGYACDGFGACQAGQVVSCAPFTCAGSSACRSTCTQDSDCTGNSYCEVATGICRADLAAGGACTSAAQCQSGFCADGVCCNTACAGTCQACSAALKGGGADGTCGNVAADTDPKASCALEDSTTCGRTGLCNASGACALFPLGAVCGATTCTAGTQTGYTCNGLGACNASGSTACAPYQCVGSVCGSSCVADSECATTHFCQASSGACLPDQAAGAACTAGAQCASGNCVDGVCCESPCAGLCQACSLSRTGLADGLCRSVSAGSDPDDECADGGAASCGGSGVCSGLGTCALYRAGTVCGGTTCSAGTQTGYACDGLGTCRTGQTTACAPYVCAGSTACRTSCSDDADCLAASWCEVTTGQCRDDLANGEACAASAQCGSGHCVDGVCCDQACAGSCRACSASRKGGGADGVCDLVTAGADPDNDCPVEVPGTCGRDGECDGAGGCRRWAPGTGCGQNACSGSQLTGSQCDGFGACVAGQTRPCDPYVCLGGNACATSCGSDADCVATAWCSAGTCVPRLALGDPCTGGNQCQSTFCVEGVCCDTACSGTCQACAGPAKVDGLDDGRCGLARPGVDPHGDCEDEGQSTCGRDGACDGAGACRLYASGTLCGEASCVGNVQTGYACTGAGVCQAGSTLDCQLYACAVGRCLDACASDADCDAVAYCDLGSGECVPRLADGAPCTEPSACASGYCVDGVCCDTACGGQCEACDVATALGACSPIAGAPHGLREPCPGATGSELDGLCEARTCDGTRSTATCVGFVGSGTPCRDAACTAGTESFSATCDGAGRCNTEGAVQARRCAPFACGAQSCLDTCAADVDCSTGNRCDTTSGQCVSGATCDGDHTVTQQDGAVIDCAPFRCDVSGACVSRCTSSAECVSPAVCNADRLCVVPTRAAAAEESGCGCRAAGRAPGPRAPLLLGLTLFGALARAWGRRARRAA